MRRRRGPIPKAQGLGAVDRSREFDDIGNQYRSFTRLELEKRVLIDALRMDQGRGPATAKAEIVWRDREYAEETGKLPARV